MSTKTDDTTEESHDPIVEIYNTEVTLRRNEVRQVKVKVEYIDLDGHSSENTVIFDVENGRASLSGFETPIGTVEDLCVVPAAETVVRSVTGVKATRHSFSTIETMLNVGHAAVENRLEEGNVPEELQIGYDRLGKEGEQ